MCDGDIGSVYLLSKACEKFAFVAGPDFGKYAGHTLVIRKALCGLKTSGARYHEVLGR
jgi:hypothetical protein